MLELDDLYFTDLLGVESHVLNWETSTSTCTETQDFPDKQVVYEVGETKTEKYTVATKQHTTKDTGSWCITRTEVQPRMSVHVLTRTQTKRYASPKFMYVKKYW